MFTKAFMSRGQNKGVSKWTSVNPRLRLGAKFMFDKMLMRTKAFIRTSEAGQGDTELRKKRDQSAPLKPPKKFRANRYLQGIQKIER